MSLILSFWDWELPQTLTRTLPPDPAGDSHKSVGEFL